MLWVALCLIVLWVASLVVLWVLSLIVLWVASFIVLCILGLVTLTVLLPNCVAAVIIVFLGGLMFFVLLRQHLERSFYVRSTNVVEVIDIAFS